jgi:hypothetical protein
MAAEFLRILILEDTVPLPTDLPSSSWISPIANRQKEWQEGADNESSRSF